jgi:hypothetical protein
MSVEVETLPPKNWKDLYVAALFESDTQQIHSRIEDAEGAIRGRARELFQAAGDNVDEAEALDDALYALHALRRCLAIHGRFATAA